jgi:hypothetical protein
MASNPKPKKTFRNLYGKSTIVETDANRPITADFLKMQ